MPLQQLQLSLQFGNIPNAARHRAALPRHVVLRAIRHALADDAEITVRIVGEEEGRALNNSYRKKDYATNVLTFDYEQEPVVVEQGKTLAAHYTHLLVHGTLHAQGWDHENSTADAQEMEAYEVAILAGLGLSNPYL
jgi:probable rRNA maturation factor